ncbi:hypothetical protein EAG_03578 [Camponotus floridanus]|uniref:Uncharacterized protein n=1 Tax=Camponotus floridanus TaxID=104421 RepID=E2ANX6_CAMFO|nr:hypothetical protein EAG_03578 [Camponotus floridanus]
MTEGEEGITQLHVGLMPGSSYGRAGREEGTAGKGAPMVGGKIEYESLMRAISALLPRPSATHSQTSRLSGCPSWPYLSLYRECAYNGGFEKGEDGRKHFESLMSRDAGDRSYRTGSDTEGAATTDNPTPPPTLTPNHRQASPFPLESTNSRRHHYNGSISSERSRNGNDTVYAAPAKKTASGGGNLGRRTRRGHASALSSSSTASDRSETVFPDEHTRIHLTNDTGRDSPPEPAPPEVPPRGPSLHATHTLRTQQNRNGCPPNAGNFTVPSDQMPTETYSGE